MGFWTKAGGIALAATGIGITAATGGAAAPLGAALVTAGAGIVSGDIQNDAAKKAGAQEQAGIKEAIGTQEKARDEATALYTPYTSTGSNAMNTLSHYMGFPAPTLGSPGGSPGGSGLAMTGPPGTAPIPTATEGMGVARNRNPGDPGATPQTQAIQQSASGYQQPTLGGTQGGGLVAMRAPTGEVRMVPREQVGQFQARGAILEGAA